MQKESAPHIRLHSQHITQADFQNVTGVVSHMGAMQAQDYTGGLWAIALRTPHLTQTDVERAIASREIVRTWPMRGTLHFVASADIRWMLKLLAPRILAGSAGRRRQLEIDDILIERARKLLHTALTGGKQLTRKDIVALFETNGIVTADQRGYHILAHLSQEGFLCLGAPTGNQQPFTLLDEWVAPAPDISRDEALATFAKRYFISHGPAHIKDFAGWGHLTLTDARKAIALAGDAIAKEAINNTEYWFDPDIASAPTSTKIHLLPGFDEYVLGYKDRSAIMDPEHMQLIVPGNNGVFKATIVENGKVIGTWKKTVRKNDVQIQLSPFQPLTAEQLQKIETSAKRYGEFLGLTAVIS